MRVGFALPNIGPLGSSESISTVSRRAEELDYDSVWTIERLLYPEKPRTPYPVTPDGSLPDVYRFALDPLDSLTFAAAHTKEIALGTSVLDIPYYNPVLLARRLTTIDVLSNGRLRIGLGLGWSEDELDATGAKLSERGRRADEALRVLKAIWTEDVAAFEGEFYRVPRSFFGHKPVQKPHPPIYMAAFAPAALARIAREAQGWNPVAVPIDGMKQMFQSIKEMVRSAGRNPDELQLIVRANVGVSRTPLDDNRMIFTGTVEQIRKDVDGCRQVGANEIIFDPTFMPGAQALGRWLELMEEWRGWA